MYTETDGLEETDEFKGRKEREREIEDKLETQLLQRGKTEGVR